MLWSAMSDFEQEEQWAQGQDSGKAQHVKDKVKSMYGWAVRELKLAGSKTISGQWLSRNSESSADNLDGSPLCRGLPNLGNTCYMNSALQCLINTESFREYFIGNHASEHSFGSEGPLTKTISALLENLWSRCPNKRAVSKNLKMLQKTIGHHAFRFSTFMQNDSQEFLACLLERLREDLNRSVLKKRKVEDAAYSNGANVEIHRTKEQGVEDVITHLYQGWLKTVLTCGNDDCCKAITTSEEFVFLHLPLPDVTESGPRNTCQNYYPEELYPDKHCTLTECMELMTSETNTKKQNWYCEGCNELVELKRKVTIDQLPQNLMVHLKRFRVSSLYAEPYKLCTHVEYPEVLDLSAFVVEGFQTPCKYDLYAMIDHHGSIHGGHYTATVCCDGEWYLFDDNKVEKLKSPQITNNERAIYVLFYKRQSNQSQGEDLYQSVSVDDNTCTNKTPLLCTCAPGDDTRTPPLCTPNNSQSVSVDETPPLCTPDKCTRSDEQSSFESADSYPIFHENTTSKMLISEEDETS